MFCGVQIFEILKNINESLQKDVWDYLSIIAPLLLSFIALVISLYNSFFANRKKDVDAKLLWDDLQEKFFVIIRNSGKKTLVIDSVSLKATKRKRNHKKAYVLGTRNNVWSANQDKAYISENETISFNPVYGSIYDVFAYKGHAFDISEENESLPVRIIVTDVDGDKWIFETPYTLKELDSKIEFMTQ